MKLPVRKGIAKRQVVYISEGIVEDIGGVPLNHSHSHCIGGEIERSLPFSCTK